MRFLLASVFCLFLFACGSVEQGEEQNTLVVIDTNLRLPSIADGMMVDTNQSALHIRLVTTLDTTESGHVIIEFDTVSGSQIINVYADSAIATVVVDSIVNEYWKGQDVRLIGLNSGSELGIPFHGLHRFPPQIKEHATLPEQYFNLRLKNGYCEVNDWQYKYHKSSTFFAPFYSDAFSPYDSSSKYPSRMRQSLDGLMMEGSAWDGLNFREGPDSAQLLAAYNEFVNKLEIFDKAGAFWTMRVAMIDVSYEESVTWGQFMSVAGDHYHHLSLKRNEAKQFLADYIANKGTDPSRVFTEEDLHLLYPDRLRWNGFISGELESRYDAAMLTNWM